MKYIDLEYIKYDVFLHERNLSELLKVTQNSFENFEIFFCLNYWKLPRIPLRILRFFFFVWITESYPEFPWEFWDFFFGLNYWVTQNSLDNFEIFFFPLIKSLIFLRKSHFLNAYNGMLWPLITRCRRYACSSGLSSGRQDLLCVCVYTCIIFCFCYFNS